MGGGFEGDEYIYIRMAESLCCPPEIITTSLIGYTQIEYNFFLIFLKKKDFYWQWTCLLPVHSLLLCQPGASVCSSIYSSELHPCLNTIFVSHHLDCNCIYNCPKCKKKFSPIILAVIYKGGIESPDHYFFYKPNVLCFSKKCCDSWYAQIYDTKPQCNIFLWT